MTAENPHTRLRKAREQAGFKSAADAARQIGMNIVTYTAHENGTRAFDRRAAANYATKFGVDAAWLLLGVNEVHARPDNANHIREIDMVRRKSDGNDRGATHGEWLLPSDLMNEQLRIDPRNACFATILGDTMYDPANPWAPGSIMPGDKVLIDCDDQTPSPPGIFAIDDGVGYSFRVVEFVPGSSPPSVRLSSRNPIYPTTIAPSESVKILGRVRGKFSIL